MPATQDTFKLALCSMPWTIFNRPSIQLASLKSYLETKSNCTVDTFHPYLQIAAMLGAGEYRQIAHSGWAGEALFSTLLFPENFINAEKLYLESLYDKRKKKNSFSQHVEAVEKSCSTWVKKTDLSQYALFGFSVCFNQLLPSLYMARLIKTSYPELPVVFGGASCCGLAGESLLTEFDEIDYIIDGEGEERLLQLCRRIENDKPVAIDGVVDRSNNNRVTIPVTPLALDQLPPPDYSPYFKEMKENFPSSPFVPHLPVEFSRGCWWNKCTFCNLNIQWNSYRYKSSDRMVQELLHLCRSHETLHFTFTDNALPPKQADLFFEEIGGMNLDLSFFAEVRTTSDKKRLKKYRQAGLNTVQVGIEALSTSLLEKMKKGTTVMDNIAMMKLCLEEDIRLEGNLITGFPTSSPEEIGETLENLHYVLPFAPLETAEFFLGFGSPVYNNPASYSIDAILVHKKMKMLLPAEINSSITPLVNSYRGDRRLQQKRWRPVVKTVAEWHLFHQKRKKSKAAALSYRDGGSFLIIRQEQPQAAALHHRLRGLSRRIYLAAATPTCTKTILEQFPQVSSKALNTFLGEMCSKRLMFRENDQILSLAIRQH